MLGCALAGEKESGSGAGPSRGVPVELGGPHSDALPLKAAQEAARQQLHPPGPADPAESPETARRRKKGILGEHSGKRRRSDLSNLEHHHPGGSCTLQDQQGHQEGEPTGREHSPGTVAPLRTSMGAKTGIQQEGGHSPGTGEGCRASAQWGDHAATRELRKPSQL